MLPIQHAARALGVPDDQLRRLAEQGSIPGAINRDNDWLIPTSSLMTIARRQGWPVEMAVLQRELDDDSISRFPGDVLAAQAAVLLARTQATAARVESRSLLQRLRETTATAEADRVARRKAAESVTGLRAELEAARREAAVAEARLAEIQARLSSEEGQLEHLVGRIAELEQERARLTRSLGWLGRRRYELLADQQRPTRSSTVESVPDNAGTSPTTDQATHIPEEITTAPGSDGAGTPLYGLPEVVLPARRQEMDRPVANGPVEADGELYSLPDLVAGTRRSHDPSPAQQAPIPSSSLVPGQQSDQRPAPHDPKPSPANDHGGPFVDEEAGLAPRNSPSGDDRNQTSHGFPQPSNLKMHRTADGRFDQSASASTP